MNSFERQFLPDDEGKFPLLEATADWASEKGLYQLTLAEVARQAGVSRPRLNYHYQTLQQIFVDLVPCWGKSGQGVTMDLVAQNMGASPEELILIMVDATFHWKAKCPTWAHLTPTLNQLAQVEKPIAQAMTLITNTGLQRIINLLEKTKVPKKQIVSRAEAIHMTMIGGLLFHLSTNKKTDREMQQSVKDSVLLILKNH